MFRKNQISIISNCRSARHLVKNQLSEYTHISSLIFCPPLKMFTFEFTSLEKLSGSVFSNLCSCFSKPIRISKTKRNHFSRFKACCSTSISNNSENTIRANKRAERKLMWSNPHVNFLCVKILKTNSIRRAIYY